MTALDDFPELHSFLGVDLKTGSLIVAALCIVHPLAYGCTFFLPMSYLLVTIWILVALFFAASIALFYGVTTDDALVCTIWIWYAVIFQTIMMMMMILLILVFATRRQKNRILAVILAMLWYLTTIYFILVVNSYRKRLVAGPSSPAPAPYTPVDVPVPLSFMNKEMVKRDLGEERALQGQDKLSDKTHVL